jgi:hypothetical protein
VKNQPSSLRIIVYVCASLGYASAVQENAAPIYVANQNPFVQIFGLPKAEAGMITKKGGFEAGFLYYVSNNAIQSQAANGESIIWDGETAQYTTRFRYGAADWLELGLDIPYIQQSGGYLDSLIRQTHDILGMPNERQEAFDKNQIHYQVKDGATTLYEMQEKKSGFGDIRISAAIPLVGAAPESKRFLALRPMIKLPTGDSDYLLGSGSTDASMGLSYSDYKTLRKILTVFHANAGLLYMGDGDVLSDKQLQFAGYGSAALDWFVMKKLELKLQVDFHSAFYDSELAQLGSSIQLLAGGTAELPGRVLLDLGISQQMITDATPDVGFYLFVRKLF